MTTLTSYDYDAPLRWVREEDQATGTEVSLIPPSGRIFFLDARGPVLRLDCVTEARWLVKIIQFFRAGGEAVNVRITRLVGIHEESKGDGYFYVVPNPGQPLVIHCTHDQAHDGCPADGCAVLEEAVDRYIRQPIVEALKAKGGAL